MLAAMVYRRHRPFADVLYEQELVAADDLRLGHPRVRQGIVLADPLHQRIPALIAVALRGAARQDRQAQTQSETTPANHWLNRYKPSARI